jgi:hypothetical protein
MKKLLILVFDVMFVMVLCFATLLTTMLLRGGMLVGGGSMAIDYSFNIITFLLTIGGLFSYLVYVLISSDKELHTMIEEQYGKEKSLK